MIRWLMGRYTQNSRSGGGGTHGANRSKWLNESEFETTSCRSIRQKIHTRLLDNRYRGNSDVDSWGDSYGAYNDISRGYGGDTEQDSDGFYTNESINRYLNEQNQKFNELINKNLEYVEHQSLDLEEVYKLEAETNA
ncbi:hypothetical protein PSN45_000113 [Yamadazyma tenuis]|nr:hypothetical protein PSN45_000113 [Yamadazyma tenuis]